MFDTESVLRVSSRTVVLLLLATLPTGPAVEAAEGRIPIPFSSPVVTPIVITQPGSYVLTRNLAATGLGPIIEVKVPGMPPGDVDIDLNGFVLNNNANPASPVVFCGAAAAGVKELRIHDGVLQGRGGIDITGITLGSTRKAALSGLRLNDGGIRVEDVQNTVIRDCVIVESASRGISVTNPNASPTQVLIEGNLIRASASYGIELVAGSGRVVSGAVIGNRIESLLTGPNGILAQNCASCDISRNTLREILGGGVNCLHLAGSSGNQISHNTITSCGDHGIRLDASSNDNLVAHNVVRGATGSGITIDGDRNHLVDNLLNGNNQRGLVFSSTADNNHYRGNIARGNLGGGGCTGPCGAGLDFCNAVASNTSQGDNQLPAAPCN